MTGHEADVIGRRLALHLRKNHFEGCHHILDYEEKKLSDVGPPTAVAELRIPLRLINVLEAHGYVYVVDMSHTDVFQLERIFGVGFKHTMLIARAVSDALREMNGAKITEGDIDE